MARRYGNPGTWGTAGPLTKKKPAPKPPPRATGFDPYRSAQSIASLQIKAMLDEVRREQEAARKTADLEAQRELAKGQAIAFGLQQLGIAPQVQSIFNTAGQNIAGLAQGFSGTIRDQASAQAAEQQRLLAGTGQEGAVRNEGANMGNVTYGMGGFIPGTELATQGAGFSAQAALQPGFATQFGQIAEAERRRKWAEELTQFGDQRAKIIGQRPALFQDALQSERAWSNDLYDRSRQQRAEALEKLKVRLNYAIATKEMTAEQAQQEWENAYKESQLALDQFKAMNPNPSITVRTLADGRLQTYVDGVPSGAPHGPKRQPRAGSKTPKKNGLTKAQYADAMREANSAAELFYYGKSTDDDGNDLPDDQVVYTISYQQALRRLQDEYGLTRRDAARIANRYYKPGQFGRPGRKKKPTKPKNTTPSQPSGSGGSGGFG